MLKKGRMLSLAADESGHPRRYWVKVGNLRDTGHST